MGVGAGHEEGGIEGVLAVTDADLDGLGLADQAGGSAGTGWVVESACGSVQHGRPRWPWLTPVLWSSGDGFSGRDGQQGGGQHHAPMLSAAAGRQPDDLLDLPAAGHDDRRGEVSVVHQIPLQRRFLFGQDDGLDLAFWQAERGGGRSRGVGGREGVLFGVCR